MGGGVGRHRCILKEWASDPSPGFLSSKPLWQLASGKPAWDCGRRQLPVTLEVTGNTGSADYGTQFLAGDSPGVHVATVPSSSYDPEDHSACVRLGFHPHKACPTLARHLEGREGRRRRRWGDRLETGGRETTPVPGNSQAARAPRSRKTALRNSGVPSRLCGAGGRAASGARRGARGSHAVGATTAAR